MAQRRAARPGDCLVQPSAPQVLATGSWRAHAPRSCRVLHEDLSPVPAARRASLLTQLPGAVPCGAAGRASLVARRAGRASLCAVPRRHGALAVAPRSARELRLTVRRCNHMWLCPACACGCVMITAPVAAPLNCAAQSAPVAALELRNQVLARRRGQHLIVHHHARRLLVPARKPPAWRLAAISGAVCPAPLFRHCPRRSAATASW